MLLAHLLLLAHMVDGGAAHRTCGLEENRAVIEKTRAMVLHKEPMSSLVGEFPTPNGTPECARATFSIDGDGHPVDVRIVESSGNFEVNFTVVHSIKKYVLKKEFLSWFRTYMLVFQVDYNKIPPGWFDGTKLAPAEAGSG